VFALALILVELVTGHSPLGDGTPNQKARAAAYPEARPTPRAYGVEVSDPVEHVFSLTAAHGEILQLASRLRCCWRVLCCERAAWPDGRARPCGGGRP
jgi:hypothetical protein